MQGADIVSELDILLCFFEKAMCGLLWRSRTGILDMGMDAFSAFKTRELRERRKSAEEGRRRRVEMFRSFKEGAESLFIRLCSHGCYFLEL